MTVEPAKNMGASVRQRLLNYARANGRPFAEVLQYYANAVSSNASFNVKVLTCEDTERR